MPGEPQASRLAACTVRGLQVTRCCCNSRSCSRCFYVLTRRLAGRFSSSDVDCGVVGTAADSPRAGDFHIFRLWARLEWHMQKRCATKPYQFQGVTVQPHCHRSTSTKWHVRHRDQRIRKRTLPYVLTFDYTPQCMLASCNSGCRATRESRRRCGTCMHANVSCS